MIVQKLHQHHLQQWDSEECDHELVGDEVEHLVKGKSYCEDCHKAVKSAKAVNEKPDT